MRILTPRIHGYLDFVVVAVFALAPSVMGLSGAPAIISYILAVVHLGLTLTTAFPMGVVKLIPFPVHGTLELIVSIALLALPWLAGFADQAAARNFYLGAGVVIFLVWLTTDYRAAEVSRTEREVRT